KSVHLSLAGFQRPGATAASWQGFERPKPESNITMMRMISTSRRTVLAGAVTVPALSISGIAVGSPLVDPIFAAIERHRLANDRVDAAVALAERSGWATEENRAVVETDEIWWQSLTALIKTEPTTLAGVAALLEHVLKLDETDGEYATKMLGSAA